MSSILPPGPDSKTNPPDRLTPPMRELADGLAAYLQAFMEQVALDEADPRDVDYQTLADDFVDSCVVDVMQVDDCGHHSWAGLMSLLDEHWPEDIFPTRYEDDPKRGAGPRIVSLMRWVAKLRATDDMLRAELVKSINANNTWRERLMRIEALTYASDDGTEYEHTHGPHDGEPECPACWAQSIRHVLGGGA